MTDVNKNQGRIVWVIAGSAAACFLAGAVLALQPLLKPAPPLPSSPRTGRELVAVLGKQRPDEFGLPAYPMAFRFHSSVSEPGREYISASYSVRRGNAKEIAGYYRGKLAAKGWKFQRQLAETTKPGAVLIKGLRQQWLSKDGKQKLSVLVLDDLQGDRTAQVLLDRGPVEPADAGK